MLLVSDEGMSSSKSAEELLTLYISASGFTTRSDIGPAREGPSEEVIACVSLYNQLLIKVLMVR